ncbi:MAG: hypothetical protein K0R51_50 [Cytophagaceae bacterium]|jgi:parallel beta-helix repeat protein|nr:hypothetical protein [Cytophagaceae bacterium]
MKINWGIYIMALCIFSSLKSIAVTIVVAPAGAAYTTIQAGVNEANAGDTVLVRAGTYNENVTFPRSGSLATGHITLMGQSGAILDGTGRGQLGIYINNRNYIRVIGMEIRNFTAAGTPIGISVRGSSSNIEILNNKVHNIENANDNAHGIAFYGTAATPMTNILVDGNEIRNCLLGQSESLVLNGNVTNFIVSNNLVHDNDNIGIDFIGFEGVGPNGSDQARNGLCIGNTVYNISTATNPTYGGDLNADGIYVDGGANITIERNTVYNSDIGIELASEHAGKNTENIIVRNNFVSGSYQANIMAGGYDDDRGNAVNIVIVNNTTYQASQGELALQFNCSNITIKNNIFYGIVGQDYLQEWGNNNTGISVSNNLYFGQSTTSPGSWADARARYVNPRITANPYMHLTATSPAIDAGLNLGNDGSGSPISGVYDIDKEARVAGAAIDIGADEYGSTLPVDWLHFEGVRQDPGVLLTWQTTFEFNNNYFEVLRCMDLETESWEAVGRVKGVGTTSVIHSYAWMDHPVSGISYYKIKQVDEDGHFSYSAVRAVHVDKDELQILLTAEGIGLVSTETTTATLCIYSELGQELWKQHLQLAAHTYYPLSTGLKSGIYFFDLSTGEQRVWKKVLVK